MQTELLDFVRVADTAIPGSPEVLKRWERLLASYAQLAPPGESPGSTHGEIGGELLARAWPAALAWAARSSVDRVLEILGALDGCLPLIRTHDEDIFSERCAGFAAVIGAALAPVSDELAAALTAWALGWPC